MVGLGMPLPMDRPRASPAASMVLGALLIVLPFLTQVPIGAIVVNVLVGLLAIGLAGFARTDRATRRTRSWAAATNVLLGLYIVVHAAFVTAEAAAPYRWGTIILGLLLAGSAAYNASTYRSGMSLQGRGRMGRPGA